jgi:hypothetical protein
MDISELLESACIKFAPDKRVRVCEIRSEIKNSEIIISGEVHDEELKKNIVNFLNRNTTRKIVDKLVVLFEKSSNNRRFGIIRVSVSNIHKSPDLSSTVVTQALMGTPVLILKTEGDWFLVQLPDRYIGWINEMIVIMTPDEYESWALRKKVIITANQAVVFEKSATDSEIVSDIVAGDILVIENSTDSHFHIAYPDMRKGFIEKQNGCELNDWLCRIALTEESIVKTAKRFMGVPYLWGGASSKALDCSGFVKTVYFLNGVLLPRDADQQSNCGIEITIDHSLSKARPGDLLLFRSGIPSQTTKITHVGIYLGNLRYIEASGDIHISSLDSSDIAYCKRRAERLVKITRIIGADETDGLRLLRNIPYYNGSGREF